MAKRLVSAFGSVNTFKLPGGVLHNGVIQRDAVFRAVDGYLEIQLAEIFGNTTESVPQRVSDILTASLERLGSVPADIKAVNALCVGDRLYLMLQLVNMIEGESIWLYPTCTCCANRFDIHLDCRQLPIQMAGQGYPLVSMNIREKQIVFRIPNGGDECWIATFSEPVSTHQLLCRCCQSVEGEQSVEHFMETLNHEEIAVIDRAIDDIAPDVGIELSTNCPECGEQQLTRVDLLNLQQFNIDNLLDEVHTLASTYHWSETDVLKLPRVRRRSYLTRIEQSRGYYD